MNNQGKMRRKNIYALALIICFMTTILLSVTPLHIKASDDGNSNESVSVSYYNDGFWKAMMTNNDFNNAFSSAVYDNDTDSLRINVNVDTDRTAWGPADYIDDEFCDWSEAKSIIVEVKNNGDSLADFRFFFSGYTDSSQKNNETHFAVGGKKNYYLKSKDGVVTQNTVGEYSIGGVNIPGSFDGYIIIPVSELSGFWGETVSLNCVKRVNFELSGEWSTGDVTMGKVGFTAETGAELENYELNFVPMNQFVFDDISNDLKVLKNWLYNLNISWLDGQIKSNGNNNSISLSETEDELNLVYDISNWTELWCDDLNNEDRNLQGYKYLILDIKNNMSEATQFGFMIANGVSGQKKYHFSFQSVFLRSHETGSENTMAISAETEGINTIIPADFNGYVIFEMNPAKMKDIYENSGATFNPENVGSINFFLKAGVTGNITIGRPMVAKSNKILDAQYSISKITDNDTKTVKFKLQGESKDYDGKKLEVSVSEEFKESCTISWFSLSSGNEIPLSSAPVDAGEYKVKAKATEYLYEDELILTINKANPANLIHFSERTYYAKEKVTELILAEESIKGTVNVTSITLRLGKNVISFQFVPENQNYKTINASIEVVAIKASPESLIKFETRTYYSGETINSLKLAQDSLNGTIVMNEIKLVKGSNIISYIFTPQDTDYDVFEGTYTIDAVDPNYTLTVNDKVFDGKEISVTVEGYPFEYTLTYYVLEDGEYKVLESAPSEIGKYKVVISSEELGEGKSIEFEIKKKLSGCGSAQSVTFLAAISVLFMAFSKRKSLI